MKIIFKKQWKSDETCSDCRQFSTPSLSFFMSGKSEDRTYCFIIDLTIIQIEIWWGNTESL